MDMQGMIIGVAVAGGTLLLVAALLVALFCSRRRNRHRQGKSAASGSNRRAPEPSRPPRSPSHSLDGATTGGDLTPGGGSVGRSSIPGTFVEKQGGGPSGFTGVSVLPTPRGEYLEAVYQGMVPGSQPPPAYEGLSPSATRQYDPAARYAALGLAQPNTYQELDPGVTGQSYQQLNGYENAGVHHVANRPPGRQPPPPPAHRTSPPPAPDALNPEQSHPYLDLLAV